MDAQALMEKLIARGVVLEAHGDKVRWVPAEALTTSEVDELACTRQTPRASPPSPSFSSLAGRVPIRLTLILAEQGRHRHA